MQQSSRAVQHNLPWAVVLILSLFMVSLLQEHRLQSTAIPVASGHHQKILNSVKDWNRFGFFQLRGMMTFTDRMDYTGQFPKSLYKSHAPFYVFPHWLGYRLGGEKGFFFTVVALVFLLAFSLSLALASLATKVLPDALLINPSQQLGAAILAGVISVPGEAVWSVAFNNFDCTAAFQLYAVGLAFISLNSHHKPRPWLLALIVLLPPLVSPRFGIAQVLLFSLIRLSLRRGDLDSLSPALKAMLKVRTLLVVAVISSLHWLHIWIARAWPGGEQFYMQGSDLLWRMGLQGDITEVAQGNYDYLSIGQAFAFLWRQSEYIPLLVRGFPISLDVEHVAVWFIGIASALLLMFRTKDKNKQVLLALLFLPGAILSVVLNQSSSEHPDYYSIFWHPALVIGLTYSILSILTRVPRKPLDLRIGVGVFSAWILFLWQVRYFFVAYPVSTNWPNN